jgi:hypothetical protein
MEIRVGSVGFFCWFSSSGATKQTPKVIQQSTSTTPTVTTVPSTNTSSSSGTTLPCDNVGNWIPSTSTFSGRIQYAMIYFMYSAGLTDFQAAGLVGNLQVEFGGYLNPFQV